MSLVDINGTLKAMGNATEKMNFENRKTGTADLDQDAFLRLLMMQLKHQDPMNPMNNQEFMAQQAQFTQIAELQKLNSAVNSSNQMMQASSLIGKTVTIINPDDPSSTIEGKVNEAKIYNDGASIVMDEGREYPINLIIGIKDSESA